MLGFAPKFRHFEVDGKHGNVDVFGRNPTFLRLTCLLRRVLKKFHHSHSFSMDPVRSFSKPCCTLKCVFLKLVAQFYEKCKISHLGRVSDVEISTILADFLFSHSFRSANMCPMMTPWSSKDPLRLEESNAHRFMIIRPMKHIIFGKTSRPPSTRPYLRGGVSKNPQEIADVMSKFHKKEEK